MKIIGQCHSMLHANGVVRIQSDIRVGSRTDKRQTAKDKVKAVEKLLAADDNNGAEEEEIEVENRVNPVTGITKVIYKKRKVM
jgi:hypothetical protein